MQGLGLGTSAASGETGGEEGGQRLVLALIISVAALAALGLTLVWMNIERTKLAYRIRSLQHTVHEADELNAKLSVEREHLLSPHELGRKAEAMGLGPARTGQIRRMNTKPEPAPAGGGRENRNAETRE